MSEHTGARVVAVVAAHNPGNEILGRVAAAVEQVAHVVVVDDGSTRGQDVLAALEGPSVTVIHQDGNRGIAAALNAGVALARKRDADAVLTLDQDSTLGASYVAAQLDCWRRAEQAGLNVGLIAAASHGGHLTPTARSKHPDGFTRAFDPMQSGSLVPLDVIERVGGFDEGLFIDGVDSEFSARIAAAGFEVLIAAGARLDHALGRRQPTTVLGRPVVLFGRRIEYNEHSPVRVYYITRNGLTLTRRYGGADPGWVVRRLIQEAKAHGMRVVLGGHRLRTLEAMAYGLRDAVRGSSGRIPDPTLARLTRPRRERKGRDASQSG